MVKLPFCANEGYNRLPLGYLKSPRESNFFALGYMILLPSLYINFAVLYQCPKRDKNKIICMFVGRKMAKNSLTCVSFTYLFCVNERV